MLVSSGRLDSLLNTVYPISDDEAVALQSYTTTDPSATGTLATVTAEIVPGVGGGINSGIAETATIVGVDDSSNTLTLQINLDGAAATNGIYVADLTEYVLGFTSNAILVNRSYDSSTSALLLNSDITSLNATLGVLSDAPIASGQIVTFTNSGTTAPPSTAPAKSDFNGDGQSDLLLQNGNGDLVIWTQSNLAITDGILVATPGPTWHAMTVADFNGDGQPDILMQNNDGDIVDYLMSGTTISASYDLGNAGPSWHVRGTADFNQDGNADILLQNDNGDMVVWTTNGTAVTDGLYVANPGPGWTVEGVADFNGDGQPDILLQNTDGGIVDYLMNGATIAAGNYLGNPGPGWAIAGTADYNNDGKADILLHNDNGDDVVWDTNGTTIIGASLLSSPGAAYTGAGAGLDLNGDGSSDLLIQQTDSTLIGYTVSSSGVTTQGADLGTPGIGWHAISNNPMEFIDGTNGNANLVATPGPDQFDLTTFAGGLQQITGFDPAQDSLALSAATYTDYAGLLTNEEPYQGGTFIALTPGTTGAAVVILGVTPDQLSAANFVLR